MARRILAIALLRAREGVRGSLAAFLLLFLVLAAVAATLTPGDPGAERQRAVDGLVLDAALFVSVLAAAAIGSASLAADRDLGREGVIGTTPLRTPELLVGGFLGHAACLGILVFGAFLGSLSLTGLLAGGTRDRAPTRTPLVAGALFDHRGEEAGRRDVRLTPRAPTATYLLRAPRSALPPPAETPEPRAFIRLREFVDVTSRGLPKAYPVGVRVGDGPERVVQVRTGNDLEFRISREEIRPEGKTPIRIRRMDPNYTLGLSPGGLVVEGPARPYAGNLLKALAGWFLALLVVSAAAKALSTVVGSPIATAGALLLALLGRSLGPLEEAAGHAAGAEGRIVAVGGRVAQAVAGICPDLRAYDLTTYVTTRWDISPGLVLSIAPRAALAAGTLLLAAWLLTSLRRRS